MFDKNYQDKVICKQQGGKPTVVNKANIFIQVWIIKWMVLLVFLYLKWNECICDILIRFTNASCNTSNSNNNFAHLTLVSTVL